MRTRSRALTFVAMAAVSIGALALTGMAQEPKTGEKPATVHLKAYIEAFNSGSLDQMKAFFEAHIAASALEETPVAQRLARYQSSRAQLKSYTIERIVAELPLQTSILVKAGNGENVLIRGRVEKAAPQKLEVIIVELVDNPDQISVPEPKAD